MRANLIALASCISLGVSAAADDDPVTRLHIRVEPSRDRQVVEGFGGSLAYWGYNADEDALRHVLGDVGATIVRVPGEVSQSGDPDAYRAAVRRVARVAPGVRFFLTFWQPRSKDKPRPEDWLDVDEQKKYRLRPAMTAAWAEELVSRVKLIRNEWGADVVAVGVQNEPNFSQPGTLTCAWEPDRLARFMADELAPRMKAAGLGSIPVAVPELAYVGAGAGEARRFAPALAGPAASIFSYHMYDSYQEGTVDPGLPELRERQRSLGRFLRERLPAKRVWMTETTGAQYNGKEWHTLGWVPGLDEHEKGIVAASYMHAALVEAGVGAFLWWGLCYTEAPRSVEGDEERQKFRDEGLILVEREPKDGTHAFLERTLKSYAFQQFAGFVRPGWVRLDVPESPESPLVAAFRNEDGREVAVVLVNRGKFASKLDIRVTGADGYRFGPVYVTDRARQCERSEWSGSLTPESVTTLLFSSEAIRAGGEAKRP